MKLNETKPGQVVRLEFGNVLVRVFGPIGTSVWCRHLDADGNESEPVPVPGSWRVLKPTREETES